VNIVLVHSYFQDIIYIPAHGWTVSFILNVLLTDFDDLIVKMSLVFLEQ